MQKAVSVTKIRDEEKIDMIAAVMADRYSRKILKLTVHRPKSALEISQETKIAISTVYRKLQQLSDLKLLKVSGRINNEGKKYFFYQSKIKKISAFFEGGNLTVKVTVNDFHT
ncbi:helix-turn-helix domain-containing protein [Nitrosopumilus sp.]|uniref:ArsR/SmtB family transcription factor n=1 Tax=Nitrosopumilus sp. TaxID=2024843 RepID=UPI002930E7AF|nr:helix-turn-helix domain-containing protein [Nitrosopumilus sp.]